MSAERDEQGTQPDTGFRVTDRRRFSESGEPRPEAGPDTAAGGEPAATDAAAGGEHGRRGAQAPAEVTFSSFVLGLSTQALVHLGEVADPATGEVQRDLAAAKHVIDIVGLLGEKTQGNLDDAERSLVESMLYDLRIRYVELVRQGASESRKETT